jgi:hypothetical protein
MPRPQSTIADHPAQHVLWDAERNLPASAGNVGHRSSRRHWWRCPVADDHRWQASPVSIARSLDGGYTGCPACAGRQVSVTNSLATRFPEIAAQWHPTRNGELTPDQVPHGTQQHVWWKCSEGDDHEWRALISSRTKAGVGCPACAGKQASVTNSVASLPLLAEEWHPTKNLPLTPDEVVAGTGRKLWWQCAEDPTHEWQATGANRSKSRGCPYCRRYLRSALEICLAYELAAFVPDLDLADDKVEVAGRIRHVDLLLRSLRVAVEVDGRYHHDGRDSHDRRKSAELEAAGWHVIRLREQPLVPLGPNDVQLPENPTTKQATDLLLAALAERDWVDPAAADAYQARSEPLHLLAALEEIARRRPGKAIRIPGTPPGPDRATRWDARYAALIAYVGREGHADVPFEHDEGETKLGNWVSVQRSRYRSGKLPADRVERLGQLPGWSWDPQADAWEAGFDYLQRFLAREGHLRVEAHHVESDGYPLGSWVRSHRRRGGRRTMTDEQRRRLETTPGWSYAAPVDQHWDRACAALADFAAEHDHVRAPSADGIDLRGWAALQRQKYKRHELTDDRIERLERIPGWLWDLKMEAWEAGFEALVAFVEREGHARVPRDHHEGDHPLGTWVGEQRSGREEMDATRSARLEDIEGWSWSPHDDQWEHTFSLLQKFVAREGHAGVPTGHVEDGVELASWVIRHRGDHKHGRVRADRAARLEALPGWMWDTRAASWEAHYRALQSYAADEGHARVPSNYETDGLRLGSWVIAQRAKRRRGDLASERIARLEAVAGWTWDGRRRAGPVGSATLF